MPMWRIVAAVFRKKLNFWGWRHKPGDCRWVPQGTRIGWVMGGDLFLEPTASYVVAQEFAGAERLAVSQQGLRRALHARGLLASVDAGRQTVLVRRTLEGALRQVLHLKASDLVDRTAEAPGAMDQSWSTTRC